VESTAGVASVSTTDESTVVSAAGAASSVEVAHELNSIAETSKKNKFFIFLGFEF